MKVSYFKNLKSVASDERPKDVSYYLDRIQNGTHEKLIKNLRSEVDPEKKKVIKNSLPGITFCGTFTSRKKENLKQGSGLAILDFDKLDNAFEFKDSLKSNDYIFSCWISPSGNGVKALVKIPIIENDIEYKQIFKQLSDYDFSQGSATGSMVAMHTNTVRQSNYQIHQKRNSNA